MFAEAGHRSLRLQRARPSESPVHAHTLHVHAFFLNRISTLHDLLKRSVYLRKRSIPSTRAMAAVSEATIGLRPREWLCHLMRCGVGYDERNSPCGAQHHRHQTRGTR